MSQTHDYNLIIQTTIVAVIVLAAIVWLVRRFYRILRNRGASKCCGCALSEKCTSKGDPRLHARPAKTHVHCDVKEPGQNH